MVNAIHYNSLWDPITTDICVPNYSGDLKSVKVQIFYGQKEVDLQIVKIWNGIWNLAAQLFENQQKYIVFTILKLDYFVLILTI